MTNQFKSSVARIFDSHGTVAGAGFLVSKTRVFTCAHVVSQALSLPQGMDRMPDGKLCLDFPLVPMGETSGAKKLTARVIFWRPVTIPSEPLSDMAILELESDPPIETQPGRMIAEEELRGHPFMSFGFPGEHINGVPAYGEIRDGRGDGRIMIVSEIKKGYPVIEGFSGAPVWDEELKAIVGMVAEAEGSSEIWMAFMIPVSLLIRAYPELDDLQVSLLSPPCPYRGLSAFKEQDANFFLGREKFTNLLVEAVAERHLVAIIGPSGRGKSSVLFAGLIPFLRPKKNWLIAHFRPGDRPFFNLASCLIPLMEPQMSETDQSREKRKLAVLLQQELNENNSNINSNINSNTNKSNILQDIIVRIMEKNPAASFFLLAIDQFEELFTSCLPDEGHAFLDLLLPMVQSSPYKTGPHITMILTLRSDFYTHAISYRPLADALNQAVQNLGPMNCQELRDAIEQPSHRLGVRLEDGLTERILEAVRRSPGNLPFLEFALTQLWERKKHGKLTHAAYNEIGGVEGALIKYAEEIYENRFNDKEQDSMRGLFTQLVRPGEGTQDIRSQATRSETGEENWNMVTRLAEARLLVIDRKEATGEETVEIAHEALIEGWYRLREWLEADR